MARSASSASGKVLHTTTPLPAASPSAFTTTRPPAALARASAGPRVSKAPWSAVGMDAARMTSLAKAFDPSSWAAAALGPKTGIPASVSLSASPSTSGVSGPTTTRAIPFPTAHRASPSTSSPGMATFSARRAVPGLPGAQKTFSASGLWAIFQTRACSRPPPPTTRIRIPGRYTTEGF
jgi:hypothetical protein